MDPMVLRVRAGRFWASKAATAESVAHSSIDCSPSASYAVDEDKSDSCSDWAGESEGSSHGSELAIA